MRAWVEDEGRPRDQVARFQALAVASATRSTTRVCDGSVTSMRLESVNATALPPRTAPRTFMPATSTMP